MSTLSISQWLRNNVHLKGTPAYQSQLQAYNAAVAAEKEKADEEDDQQSAQIDDAWDQIEEFKDSRSANQPNAATTNANNPMTTTQSGPMSTPTTGPVTAPSSATGAPVTTTSSQGLPMSTTMNAGGTQLPTSALSQNATAAQFEGMLGQSAATPTAASAPATASTTVASTPAAAATGAAPAATGSTAAVGSGATAAGTGTAATGATTGAASAIGGTTAAGGAGATTGGILGGATAAGTGATAAGAGAGVGAGAGAGAAGGSGAAGAGGVGVLGFWPVAVVAAVAGAMQWESNTGTNTWGQQIRDPGGSAVRRGEQREDFIKSKLGDNVWGDSIGGFASGSHKVASGRPREMWEGAKDMTIGPTQRIREAWGMGGIDSTATRIGQQTHGVVKDVWDKGVMQPVEQSADTAKKVGSEVVKGVKNIGDETVVKPLSSVWGAISGLF